MVKSLKISFWNITVLLSAVMAGLCSCNPQSELRPILGFSPYVDQTVPYTGGEFKITVQSNLDWTVRLETKQGLEPEWCHLSKSAGFGADSVFVLIDQNPAEGELRQANLIFAEARAGGQASGGVPEKGFAIMQRAWVNPGLDLFTVITDDAFLAYCQPFDTDSDGVLSVAEAEQVKSINVTGYEDITSLEGITYFSELTSLQCAQTGIDTLSVVNLFELRTLDYSGTPIRTAVDLAACPKLTTLNCSNTAITTLDVTRNPELAYLRCNNTPLSVLDVSHCPELRELWCAHTRLQALDISLNEYLGRLEADPNPLLTVIYVSDDFKIGMPPSDFHIPTTTINPAHYERKER